MKEQTVEDVKKEILSAASSFYAEVEKTGDWDKFNLKMNNLYRSYGLGTNEVYQQAMLEIITKKPESKIEAEIIKGNHGLSVQAFSQPETAELIDVVEKINAEFGEKVAKAVLKGSDKCTVWAAKEKQLMSKQTAKNFDMLIDVVTKTCNF